MYWLDAYGQTHTMTGTVELSPKKKKRKEGAVEIKTPSLGLVFSVFSA